MGRTNHYASRISANVTAHRSADATMDGTSHHASRIFANAPTYGNTNAHTSYAAAATDEYRKASDSTSSADPSAADATNSLGCSGHHGWTPYGQHDDPESPA